MASRKQQQNKTTEIGPNIYLITIKVNELNSPVRRQRLPDYMKIWAPTIYCL